MPTPHPFFDYTCDACDSPVCERVQLMNLALAGGADNNDAALLEEAPLLCLSCLAEQQGATPQMLAEMLVGYIFARDCFKKPWEQVNASQCPKRENNTCCWMDE